MIQLFEHKFYKNLKKMTFSLLTATYTFMICKIAMFNDLPDWLN
jgi:hypothetical protein